jgi:hypothetical protein
MGLHPPSVDINHHVAVAMMASFTNLHYGIEESGGSRALEVSKVSTSELRRKLLRRNVSRADCFDHLFLGQDNPTALSSSCVVAANAVERGHSVASACTYIVRGKGLRHILWPTVAQPISTRWHVP